MRLASVLFILTGGAAGFAQPASDPAFEVASIRPAEFPNDAFFRGFTAGGGTCGKAAMKISGDRVTISVVSLCGLIRIAYDLPDYRISGAPAWTQKVAPSLFYQIEAKAPGENALTEDRAKVMFQTLLADRFQLKFHRESKELPVYNLVVGKSGHKLSTQPLPATGACSSDINTKMAAMENNPGTGLTACRPTITMSQLADSLKSGVDRPVLDQTGLTEKYALSLHYTPEGKDYGPNGAPALFTAIQEQLGLKLEPPGSRSKSW